MRTHVKQRRKSLKLSQQEVAQKAGLTRSNYAHIERGRHNPSVEQMQAIAQALQLKNPNINFFVNFCDETYQK